MGVPGVHSRDEGTSDAASIVAEVLAAEQDVAERAEFSSRRISRDVDLRLQLGDWPAGRRQQPVDAHRRVDLSTSRTRNAMYIYT